MQKARHLGPDALLHWLYGRMLPDSTTEPGYRIRLLLLGCSIIGSIVFLLLAIQLTSRATRSSLSAPWTDIAVEGMVLLVVVAVLVLARSGRERLAARLFVLGILVGATVTIYVEGSAVDSTSGALSLIIAVLLARVLLNERESWLIFLAASVIFAALQFAWDAGYLPDPQRRATDQSLFATVVWVVAAGIIMTIANTTMKMLLRQAESLEQQVADRTAELRASEQRFRVLFEHSPLSTLLVDPDTRTIRDCNAAACALYGYTRSDLIGQPVDRLAAPDEAQHPVPPVDSRTPDLDNLHTFEAQRVRKNGALFPAEISTTRIEVGGEDVLLDIERDITRQKQAERALEQALAAEIEVNHLRSRFLSIASHDLRTPLAAIQATVDLVMYYGDRLSAEKKRSEHGRIRMMVQQMVDMLDDLLIVARGDSGGWTGTLAPLDLVLFCEELIEEHARADDRLHPITLNVQGDPHPITVNHKPLRHVISNLISNALKYSPPSTTVTLTLSFAPDTLTLSVADKGIGIPEAQQAQLFEPFFRASNVGERSGTGLGMAIVAQAVRLMQGTIDVESAENDGTTVTVTLPLAP